MSINMNIAYVLPGNEGRANNDASAIGLADDIQQCQSRVFIPRGIIDLNENRLPTIEDSNVRPTDAIVALNAFIVSGAGTAPSGVTGKTALVAGDYLVLMSNSDPAIAANWMGVSNNNLNKAAALPYWGTNTKNIRIIGEPLPFFP